MLMAALGGVFLFPLFFLDFSMTEYKELDLLTTRYNHLVNLSENKECNYEYIKLPTTGRKPGWLKEIKENRQNEIFDKGDLNNNGVI